MYQTSVLSNIKSTSIDCCNTAAMTNQTGLLLLISKSVLEGPGSEPWFWVSQQIVPAHLINVRTSHPISIIGLLNSH